MTDPGSRVIFGRARSRGEKNMAFGQRGGVGLESYGVAIGYGEGGLRPEGANLIGESVMVGLAELVPPYECRQRSNDSEFLWLDGDTSGG
jgi:hypothetical protein